jgi:hypothetical protein
MIPVNLKIFDFNFKFLKSAFHSVVAEISHSQSYIWFQRINIEAFDVTENAHCWYAPKNEHRTHTANAKIIDTHIAGLLT